MIKLLRRKFITIAMASTALVLILIISGINIANYLNVIQTTDAKLEILAANQGVFPNDFLTGGPKEADHSRNDSPDENLSQNDYDTEPDDGLSASKAEKIDSGWLEPQKPYRRYLTAETPYDTRYFTVTLKEDGSLFTTNTRQISAVSSSEAVDYAKALFSKGSTSGFVGIYKYTAVTLTSDSDDSSRIMYIFLDCERELTTFRTFLTASMGISMAALLLVFGLVCFFSRAALRPVAESYAKQKRFITDASHELKTPLTIIDANTEILEMMEGENEWTASIRSQILRLKDLTEKMVLLTRMDEENTTLTMLDFSLSDAVIETAEPFLTVAQTHHRMLSLEVAPNLTFHGDEASIRQMLSLLLDNAIKYSSEPGEIRLKLERNGKNKLLSIWNTVDEITPGNLDVLLDRFYRRDTSRSQKTAGHGIGLSVVQAIVLAHKGKISVRSSDGRSILFHIVL